MIKDNFQIRPRYGEVDRMGYVYHANYIDYCHQARTELLRKMNIDDNQLEQMNIILPVISFEINYKKPAFYDELLTISTIITEIPKARFTFKFEIRNERNEVISLAKSTVVFVNKETRHPMAAPDFIINRLKSNLNLIEI